MGSSTITCSLTKEIIKSQDEVVMLVLTRKPYEIASPVSSWDIYCPVPILFEGNYDGYGFVEDIKLFQSQNVINEEELDNAKDYLFKSLKEVMDREKVRYSHPLPFTPNNLEDLLGERDIGFMEEDAHGSLVKKVVNTIVELVEENGEDNPIVQSLLEKYQDILGFSDIKEMQEYLKENEKEYKFIPISFMMFRKDAFMRLLNEYGMEEPSQLEIKKNSYEERYAIKVQRERNANLTEHGSETTTEMVSMLNNFGSYAGANRPQYSYDTLVKQLAKEMVQYAGDMSVFSKLYDISRSLPILRKMHGLDITLLNDYFNTLGISYQPNIRLSESICDYGHKEAYNFQQSLTDSTKPKNKIKI
jgi:hypothetical protein